MEYPPDKTELPGCSASRHTGSTILHARVGGYECYRAPFMYTVVLNIVLYTDDCFEIEWPKSEIYMTLYCSRPSKKNDVGLTAIII